MNPICLCFSTGRSGTTFLAHTLKAAYGPDVDVFHEDVGEFQSKPGKYLWHTDRESLGEMRRDPVVAAHVKRVAELSRDRPYVDVGHPAISLIPLFLEAFPGRIRLLHLVRDPVLAAASMAVRGMYDPRFDGLEGPDHNFPPNPNQTRCAHPEFAADWYGMTPFEKNLWRWGEYHLFALAIHEKHPEVPYLKLLSSDLFQNSTSLSAIATFYGLPKRTIVPKREFRNETHPNLTSAISIGKEWKRYVNYPYIRELAKTLGVPPDMELLEKQMMKYAAPSAWKTAKYRWRVRFTRRWLTQKLASVGIWSKQRKGG